MTENSEYKTYDFVIKKSIEFLTSTQLPHGEFRTEIQQQDETGSLLQFDSSPFSTALILNSLSFLQPDQRVQQIREKGINFLREEVEDYGLWRYWSSRNPKHNLIPPDLDDTCCISQLLKSNNIEFPDNRDIILNNRNAKGLFYTWVLSTPKQNKLHSNDEWVINQEEDICCVVNANTVLYLDADEECQDAINYLIEVFHNSSEQFYSPFYNHVTPFYYALSRIIYSRHSPLDSIKEELIEQILSLQKYDGSFGDELKTALAVCSLLNCGFDGDNLTSAIDFLIQSQQSDGSWRRIPWYGGHADKAMYGSAELTTGFCLEALARYRDLKLQPTQQPSNVNSLCRLVRSQEWWLYKIAPLLTIAYAETLLLQLPPTTATLTTLTALLSIASVAAYGYLLNDICDIESDQKANKSNAAAQLQPWQRLLLCLLFIGTGFAAPLLTHLSTIPLALLIANYLLPTLYSVPPLRLKERGIWGILSDAAGAHLVPTLFVAATLLSHTPDAPRNALLFTGIAATHAFFVGLRGILLHQLWDRANDLNAGITTFVTQQPPETVQRWINRLVFPVEILLLGGVALLLCQSTPALTAFFAVYLLLTAVNVKTAPYPFTPSPPKGQNIIPHDLYEVWLPLALAITLAVQNPQFLIFVALTAILFYPSLKVRSTELFYVIKAGFTPMPNPTPPTAEAPRPTPTNVAPLTPEMQQQLETEGYVVLEDFLTPDELEDLRELVSTDPLPENAENLSSYTLFSKSDPAFRQHHNNCLKSIVNPKLITLLPNHRAAFCTWYRKSPNSSTNATPLHQDPSFSDETKTLSYGIWCPLIDVTPENSCLSVVKGSHHLNSKPRPFYRHSTSPYDSSLASFMQEHYLTPIPLKAGQAILHDRRLFHGASPNTQDQERVALTCIIAPQNTLTHFAYRESAESETLELFAVEDDFYNRYILGEKPHGDGVKLIKTEPYSYDPLTPELIAEKLDPLHREKSTQPQAIEQYRQTLQHFQTQAQQHFQQLQNQLHQTQSELNQLKTYLQQTQGTAGLFNYYRHCINQQPDNLDLYQEALTLQPDNLELRLQLGQTLTRQNRPEEAIATYQTALESHPHWQLYLALGQTLEQVKRDAEAITAYERAIQLNPHHSPIYEHLGDLLAEQNQLSAASQCYRRVLELQQG